MKIMRPLPHRQQILKTPIRNANLIPHPASIIAGLQRMQPGQLSNIMAQHVLNLLKRQAVAPKINWHIVISSSGHHMKLL